MSTNCENLVKKLLVLKPSNRACLEVRRIDFCDHAYHFLLITFVIYYTILFSSTVDGTE